MSENWKQVDIYTTSEGLDIVCSELSDIGHPSAVISDAADFERFLEGEYGAWDYYDKSLLKLRGRETTVTVYIADDSNDSNEPETIKEMLLRLKESDISGVLGRLEYMITDIYNKNRVDEWKDHFKPFDVGERFIICPPWEECDPGERLVLIINPGMAFGTGLDETTRLCLEALENTVIEGCCVLDAGCGSGILSIGAVLLGAASATGIDIDQAAVKSAVENASLNSVYDRTEFVCGNLTDNITSAYDIVCANISADTIINLMPVLQKTIKPGGILILSGIIEDREQDILDLLPEYNLILRERREENGWLCIIVS